MTSQQDAADGFEIRTMADVIADREAQIEHLDYLEEVLDEMLRDAEIDVFHRRRSTQQERIAYVTELVAHASDHALAMAHRELRLLNTTNTSSLALRRTALTRAKRPSQIYPSHYQDRSA